MNNPKLIPYAPPGNSGKQNISIPSALYAEESVLAYCIANPDESATVLDGLKDFDFVSTRNQLIYKAIVAVIADGARPEVIVLGNKMSDLGTLATIGGYSALASMFDTIPISIHLRSEIGVIQEKTSLRNALKLADSIKQAVFASQASADIVGLIDKGVKTVECVGDIADGTKIGDAIDNGRDSIDDNSAGMGLPRVPTGFRAIDEKLFGFHKGDFFVLGARPAMGKTALALNMAMEVSREHGVLFFSLEMPETQLALRMVSANSMLSGTKMKHRSLNIHDWEKFDKSAAELMEHNLTIYDSVDVDITKIKAICRKKKRDDPTIELVIIDYIQLMTPSAGKGTRELEVSEISRGLKLIAKELDITVLALSQLNRKLEERADKRPELSDLRESGSLEQDSDIVCFLYRDEIYNKEEDNPLKGTAEFIIKKHRGGATGTVNMTFDGEHMLFKGVDVLSEYEEQGHGAIVDHR